MALSTIAAYALIACFLVMVRLTRQGLAAKSLEAGPFDIGSTQRLGVAFAAGILVLLLIRSYRYRIECEEAMLLVTLAPHYQSYRERTWRLTPYIY